VSACRVYLSALAIWNERNLGLRDQCNRISPLPFLRLPLPRRGDRRIAMMQLDNGPITISRRNAKLVYVYRQRADQPRLLLLLRSKQSPRPDKALFYPGRQRRAQFIPRGSSPRRETARDALYRSSTASGICMWRVAGANASSESSSMPRARGSHSYNAPAIIVARSSGRSARSRSRSRSTSASPDCFPLLG